MRVLSERFLGDVIMLTPPFRERGRRPALEGIRAGAAIRARTSLGAAFWKSQSRESGTISQHCWGRDQPRLKQPVSALCLRRLDDQELSEHALVPLCGRRACTLPD